MAKKSSGARPKTKSALYSKLTASKLTASKLTAIKARNIATSLTYITAYATHAALGKLTIRDRNKRLKFFTENIGRYTRKVLKGFHFQSEVVGLDAELLKRKNFLFVANHMSYVDILLLSSVTPSVFVTSVDLGETAFLGTMAELGGSIFIERRNRARISRDVKVMADCLRAGFNVVVFPEGTSTNGEKILPFKTSLLMAAVEAGVDIMPLVIKYTEVDGQAVDATTRGRIAWYGDTSFITHFMALMKTTSVKAELHFLPAIPVTKDSSRHELAEKAYKAITDVYFSPSVSSPVS